MLTVAACAARVVDAVAEEEVGPLRLSRTMVASGPVRNGRSGCPRGWQVPHLASRSPKDQHYAPDLMPRDEMIDERAALLRGTSWNCSVAAYSP